MDDERLEALQRRFGNDGYAIFFKLLELQTEAQGKPVDLREDWRREILISKCYVTEERFLEIVSYAAKIGLFKTDEWETARLIFSDNLANHLNKTITKRESDRSRKKTSSTGSKAEDLNLPMENHNVPSENEHLPPEHDDKEERKKNKEQRENINTPGVCLENEFEQFAQKGLDYLLGLNHPNLSSPTWVKGYLTLNLPTLIQSRPDLRIDAVLACWMDTCDAAVTDGITSPNWFKKVFESRVEKYNPKSTIKRPSVNAKPENKYVRAWREGKSFLCLVTCAVYLASELKPVNYGSRRQEGYLDSFLMPNEERNIFSDFEIISDEGST